MQRFKSAFLLIVVLIFSATALYSQSIVSGEISGMVADPSGAAIPNATVVLQSKDTGARQQITTGATGEYRFPLLRPGVYHVAANATGFAEVGRDVIVALGQVTNTPIQLGLKTESTSIEVTADAPLLQSENGNISSNFDSKQIDLLPAPGNDITAYAFTAPGVTLSTGGGYGNFTAYGLPATSNLYTVNGADYNDPYNNLNNSGASNLTLGSNEVQELTIVNNGYTGQYGRLGGANVNYSTRSGTNSFHGNAKYFYNGDVLNANDWFNNNSGTPRPKAVNNQWAGRLGGPIVKDKLFFFFNTEGLRYVLPGGGAPVYVPTSAFAAATLANISATQPSEVPFYQNIFKLYSGAPGIGRATPVAGSCADLVGTAGFGANTACVQTFRSTVNNLNTERLFSGRVDWNASDKDKFAFRYKQDRGVQATGTDPINSAFNANSVQPQDEGQLTYSRIFTPNLVNQFIASGLYYSAVFGPPNLKQSLATFPTTLTFEAPIQLNNLGGTDYNYPQGRNVAQYQFVDDLSWTRGAHGLKFGVNFRRNNLTEFGNGLLTSGNPDFGALADFYNGVLTSANGSSFTQAVTNVQEAPERIYSLGLYGQDEWQATRSLKLTLALRVDRNSNEYCPRNCYSRFPGSFLSVDHNPNTPYNASVLTGQSQIFRDLQPIAWQPRMGFAFSPQEHKNTVIRGGLGLFSDLYPASAGLRFLQNLPQYTTFLVSDGTVAPGAPNSVFSQVAASNAALQSGFANGATLAQLRAAVPAGFSSPNFSSAYNKIKNPQYVEWNLELEQAIGNKTAATINYVGNHGYDEFVQDRGLNAYCPASNAKCAAGFGDLPKAAPDPRFGRVNELRNSGFSNYQGVTLNLQRRFSGGFTGNFNYTYSHDLDIISNGGFYQYSFNTAGDSLRYQIDPYNARALNYGPSDYDFRHVISANFVWQSPFKFSNGFMNQALGGWTFSGLIYHRTGQPFSVVNNYVNTSKVLRNSSGAPVLADFLGGSTDCSHHPSFDANNPYTCLNTGEFGSPTAQHDYGTYHRNAFRGPHYFDTDLSLEKAFRVAERYSFTLGAHAYNVFNHPNFANPDDSVTSATFGQILSTVSQGSSPYGSFQGSAVSGRVVQVEGRFDF